MPSPRSRSCSILEQVGGRDRHVGIVAQHGLVDGIHAGLVGRLVHDVLDHPLAVVGLHHEVDELGSAFRIVGGLGDDHGVHPEVGAFLGDHVFDLGFSAMP